MAAIQPGMTVRVRAKDDFYGFVDGWFGRVAGWQSGYVVVECQRDDGMKTLLVPGDQLEATPE